MEKKLNQKKIWRKSCTICIWHMIMCLMIASKYTEMHSSRTKYLSATFSLKPKWFWCNWYKVFRPEKKTKFCQLMCVYFSFVCLCIQHITPCTSVIWNISPQAYMRVWWVYEIYIFPKNPPVWWQYQKKSDINSSVITISTLKQKFVSFIHSSCTDILTWTSLSLSLTFSVCTHTFSLIWFVWFLFLSSFLCHFNLIFFGDFFPETS